MILLKSYEILFWTLQGQRFCGIWEIHREDVTDKWNDPFWNEAVENDVSSGENITDNTLRETVADWEAS